MTWVGSMGGMGSMGGLKGRTVAYRAVSRITHLYSNTVFIAPLPTPTAPPPAPAARATIITRFTGTSLCIKMAAISNGCAARVYASPAIAPETNITPADAAAPGDATSSPDVFAGVVGWLPVAPVVVVVRLWRAACLVVRVFLVW